MNYRYLGKTGLKVSELCLGSMTFGNESIEEDSFKIMDRFVEAGGNFIDTADAYSHGISEEIIGRWLKGKNRDDYVIATKVRFPTGKGPNDSGLSRKHILAEIKRSLQRLGTEYIDLYQVHAWDPGTPLEETLSTLNDLVRQGLVRYTGASNYKGWQLQKAIDTSRQRGFETFSCLQQEYNLLCRAAEWELLEVCENEGLGMIPYSPLRGGWLSGKFHRDMTQLPQDSRVGLAKQQGGMAWSENDNEHTWKVLDVLYSVAKEVDKTPAQVAMNWLLQNPNVTAPITGVRTMEHLESNLGATGWSLNQEQMEQLNQASELPATDPYDRALEKMRSMDRK